jgi:hypothetical protein
LKLLIILIVVLIVPAVLWALRSISIGKSTDQSFNILKKNISGLFGNRSPSKRNNSKTNEKESN